MSNMWSASSSTSTSTPSRRKPWLRTRSSRRPGHATITSGRDRRRSAWRSIPVPPKTATAPQRRVARQPLELVADLAGQLAGRGQHERARSATALAQASLQDGQREGGGLAGAGLGQPEDVASCEGGRQGGCLDGAGSAEAGFGERAAELGEESQLLESDARGVGRSMISDRGLAGGRSRGGGSTLGGRTGGRRTAPGRGGPLYGATPSSRGRREVARFALADGGEGPPWEPDPRTFGGPRSHRPGFLPFVPDSRSPWGGAHRPHDPQGVASDDTTRTPRRTQVGPWSDRPSNADRSGGGRSRPPSRMDPQRPRRSALRPRDDDHVEPQQRQPRDRAQHAVDPQEGARDPRVAGHEAQDPEVVGEAREHVGEARRTS